MDIIALQVRSDGWLSYSQTIHGENYNNYVLIGFQYSCTACEKVAKGVMKVKAPGKRKGKQRDKRKAGNEDGNGYVSSLFSLTGLYVPCCVVCVRMLLACAQQQRHSLCRCR